MKTHSGDTKPSLWKRLKSSLDNFLADRTALPQKGQMEEDISITPEQKAELDAIEAFQNKRDSLEPKRSDYPDGDSGGNSYAKALEKYMRDYFNQDPDKLSAVGLTESEFRLGKKLAGYRSEAITQSKVKAEKSRRELMESVARIDPAFFADMNAEEITELAPYASLAQLKALMASKHWIRDDKRKMLGARWEEVIWLENHDEKLLLKDIADSLRKGGRSTRPPELSSNSGNRTEAHNSRCKECNGEGSVKCPECHGSGAGSVSVFVDDYRCKHCSGSGRKKCGVCEGKGKIH